ncbi:MAG: 30S ribosomal protein S20 [Planctomycetes bacterium]|nr:30S ribosomal protein S20 [Planctomycetota bacterium]
MAHSLSAKKRIRQNEKNRLRNRVRKEKLKKALRGFDEALKGDDKQVATEELKKVQKALDKAKTKGILHRRNVDRRKARLAKAVNRTLAETTPGE